MKTAANKMSLTMTRLANVRSAVDAGRELQSARIRATGAERMAALGKASKSTVAKAWREFFAAEDVCKAYGVK